MIGIDGENIGSERNGFSQISRFLKMSRLSKILEIFKIENPTEQNSILRLNRIFGIFKIPEIFGNLNALENFDSFKKSKNYKNIVRRNFRSRNKFPSRPENFGISYTSNNQIDCFYGNSFLRI